MTTLEDDDTESFSYNPPSLSSNESESRMISEEALPDTPEGFEYAQSTLQGFYFVEDASFDGLEVSSDDWIVAYNNNIVVGSWPWRGAYTTVPVMGYDQSDETIGYMESGQHPTFKLFRSEDGSLNDMTVVGDFDSWTENGVSVITLSGATVLPSDIALNGAYPNPFNPSTNISFEIPSQMQVSLVVYDINGRMVAELVNEVKHADVYNVVWNASQNASGMYIVKLTAGNAVHTQKIMLIK